MYYDGTKLLSLNDLEGNRPEIYICSGNRTGGKTTYFNRLVVNRFLKTGSKFCIEYRFNNELSGVSERFFKDICGLFFPEYAMSEVPCSKGQYYKLLLNGNECGYAISINNPDVIKKNSHIFNDVDSIIFDEFQSESGHYCSDEVKKFISIHTSIARGQGKQVRYVPVYMISNTVSIINPYFVELGICDRLRFDTKFLRGRGFVLEQTYNETASEAQQQSGFNKAFSGNKYIAYSSQNVYLNDSAAFIQRPEGKGRYLATIKFEGRYFGIREFAEIGVVYCDDNYDSSYPLRISLTTADHDVNYVMLKQNDTFLQNMRFLFDRGCFRFKNMLCKQAVLRALSY